MIGLLLTVTAVMLVTLVAYGVLVGLWGDEDV